MSEKADDAYKALTCLCMRLGKLREQALEVGDEAAEARRALMFLREEIRAADDPDSAPPEDDADALVERLRQLDPSRLSGPETFGT